MDIAASEHGTTLTPRDYDTRRISETTKDDRIRLCEEIRFSPNVGAPIFTRSRTFAGRDAEDPKGHARQGAAERLLQREREMNTEEIVKRFGKDFARADAILHVPIVQAVDHLVGAGTPLDIAIGMIAQILVAKAVLITTFPGINAKRLSTERLLEKAISAALRSVRFVDDPVTR
jgi:hypothetical protein